MKNVLKTLRLALLLSASSTAALAQTTFTDNFGVAHDYIANGVNGTIWDGVYLGAGEIASPTGVGAAAGSVSVANAGISGANLFSVASVHTDWENAADDGFLLFKVVTGDFDMSVHVIGPIDTGAFNIPGLMVRAFGPAGAPPQPANSENSFVWGRFDEFGIANILKNNVNGAKTDTGLGTNPNTNFWLRVERVGDNFNLYEKALETDPWLSVGVATRTDFAGVPLQAGIEQSDYGNGTTRSAQFEKFSLSVSNLNTVVAPAAATGLTIGTNGGDLVLNWTAGAGSDGRVVVMWTGSSVLKEAPAAGVTYAAHSRLGSGDTLPGTNYYVVYSGSGTSITVSNIIGGVTYNAAVFSYAGSGNTISYNHTPPTSSAVGPALIVSITLTAPSSVIVGSARKMGVTANFDNFSTLDVTAVAAYTSSAPAVVSIQSPGRLAAPATGSAQVWAAYKGFFSTQSVTVASMSMTHRWSFGDDVSSLSATDSVGTATATLINDVFYNSDGQIHFGGTAGYIQLPNNLFTNYGGATYEPGVNDAGSGPWARIFDFGNDQTHYSFLTPQAGGTLGTRFATTTNGGGGEQLLNMSGRIPLNTPTHVVVTTSGASRQGKLYVNGVLIATNGALTVTPEDIGPTANLYLGKSQYNDPYFTGSIDEFRTYNGVLDSLQIALNAATGPDVITNTPGSLTSLQLTAGSPIQQFQREQLTLVGNFANIANQVTLTTAQGTTYRTSDPNIATVDGLGVLTANGAGTANISGIFGNTTSTVAVTVTPVPPGMTHRYSFNTDFNDSVGTAHGVPHGNAGLTGTAVILDGSGGAGSTAGTYVELPPNLLLGYSSIAFEVWYTDTDTGNANGWARIFDFSSSTANYLFLTPMVGNNAPAYPYTMRTAFLLAGQTGGEEQINIPRPSLNAEHHVVWTIDAATLKGRLYVDGVLQLERNGTRQPRDLGPTSNDWLGRSPFGDPLFIGTIDEFRIYNGIITPQQVYLDYLTGPDVITNGGAISGVALSLTNMPSQSKQQALLLANYAFTNVPVAVMSGYSNWLSSDLSVAKVDAGGLITSIKPGVATISANFNGSIASSNLTVTAGTPTLAHRYSFDSDATDSIGAANGNNAGGAVFSGGRVFLNGATNSYVSLPGHLFDGFKEVTLESWITVSNTAAGNTRVWDFGDSATTNYMFFTPASLGNTVVRWNFEVNPGNAVTPLFNRAEQTIVRSFNGLNNGSNLVHYVWVFSDVQGKADCYINGVFQDTWPYSWFLQQPTLSRLINNEAYLGHASMTNPVAALPANNYQGAIDEFRIWNGALTSLQVETSFAAGPTNATVNPGAPSSLTLTLNDPTMVLGTIQRPTVSATFGGLGKLDLTSVPDVVFTSSDSTKIQVIGGGDRSEEHTSELQSRLHLVCRLLLEYKKTTGLTHYSPLPLSLSCQLSPTQTR